ncbi:MAG: SpoIIE family protein phosphatase, partial [Halanaerobacter sp.]
MQPLLWLRIIIISKLIVIFDYLYFKPIILSLLTISSILFFAESNNWQLLIIEALYYLTLTLFLNYRSKTNLKIEKMAEKQSANFAKARQIHQNSLPDSLPAEDDITMAAFYQPAEELGGDYYNVFKVDHGSMNVFFDQYFIYMFDVSGHGIDSAMLAIFINNTIEDYFKLQHEKGETVSPEKILSYIDKQYRAEEYPGDYLVCLLVGVLDLNSYEFTYSSSGFQFPFYKLSPDGSLVEL